METRLVGGRYELDEVVGSGGMATVWKARDAHLGRTVALKRPHPLPPDDPRHDRLAREARLAASVTHPNLVQIHDAGADADGLFLVMEYIDAPSLAEVGAGLDQPSAMRACAQVADALAAIHRAGVVHRDVKPSNVLMAPTGAKLVDFGAAFGGDPVPGFEPTVTGVALGTIGYMAPEVLQGQPAGPPSDVYGLGVTMYELLLGRRPEVDGGTPPMPDGRLGPLVAACLSPDPAARPPASDVARHINGGGVILSPTTAGPTAYAPTDPGTTILNQGPVSNGSTEVMSVPVPPSSGRPTTPRPTGPLVTGAPRSGGGPPTAVPYRPSGPDTSTGPSRPGPGSAWRSIGLVVAGALAALVGFVLIDGLTGQDGDSTEDALGEARTEANGPSTTPPVTLPDPALTSSTIEEDEDLFDGGDEDGAETERRAFDLLEEQLADAAEGRERAGQIAQKIGEAAKELSDGKPDEALKKLEDGAEEAEKLDGRSRRRALEMLDRSAIAMGLGDPEFRERFDDDDD